MSKINEATDTDLKVIEELKKVGWKVGDTLLYQKEYILTPEQQKIFEERKSIKPDITLRACLKTFKHILSQFLTA